MTRLRRPLPSVLRQTEASSLAAHSWAQRRVARGHRARTATTTRSRSLALVLSVCDAQCTVHRRDRAPRQGRGERERTADGSDLGRRAGRGALERGLELARAAAEAQGGARRASGGAGGAGRGGASAREGREARLGGGRRSERRREGSATPTDGWPHRGEARTRTHLAAGALGVLFGWLLDQRRPASGKRRREAERRGGSGVDARSGRGGQGRGRGAPRRRPWVLLVGAACGYVRRVV